MLKESLVYIRKASGGEVFVGCGAFVEQNLIATCRHVWRDAGDGAEAVFPHIKRGGGAATSTLELIDACKATDGDDPDVVLLRATNPPDGLTPLQIARGEAYETGDARALARLPTRKIDREIPGSIGGHIDEKGRRAFSQSIKTGYWLEKGSSGSPIFVGAGQQLAGLVSMAELGDKPQNAPVREAYVVPGTAIWPFIRAVAQRELDARQRGIEQALEEESQAAGARDLILEIARRSSGDAASTFEQALPRRRSSGDAPPTFEQALANARAAFEEGQKAISAGGRERNLGPLVDDLLEKLGERTLAGDFDSGAGEADRAFAEWEKYEADRRATSVAAGVGILSAGARQDILRRNFVGAAKRYARIVDLENPNSRRAALRARQDEFYIEGRDKGVNASLEVAIELARLALAASRNGDDHLSVQNDLGLALTALGERETGTARLEEAVRAYRAALKDKRVRVPPRSGDDAEQSRPCALEARRTGERDGTARGGGHGFPRGAGGEEARASSIRLG
jgi:tetratricopeptide (TPR) repeat protein